MTATSRIPPFQEFLDEHRVAVYRFLRATVGPNDADDVFQETFLSALRAYPRLRDAANLHGWVMAIAARKVIDAGRARGRRAVPVGDVEAHGAGAPSDPPPDLRDGLWSAVRTLPARQRVAVVHRFVLDRSYRQIADVMGGTEETARANVSQGIRKLRASREGWDDEGD